MCLSHFFFNDTATTEIYTLSLHDALPISDADLGYGRGIRVGDREIRPRRLRPLDEQPYRVVLRQALEWRQAREIRDGKRWNYRSEEHTSELQSRQYLVCRLLLEKKKQTQKDRTSQHETTNITKKRNPSLIFLTLFTLSYHTNYSHPS